MDENGNIIDEMTGEIIDDDTPAIVTQSRVTAAPQFKDVSSSRYYDTDQIVDYADLEKLNSATRAARIALFEITDDINKFERAAQKAKLDYDRAHRRVYLESSEKTDSARRMRADLACENLENKKIMLDQARSELVRLSHSIRLELQSLQALGNNLRQQIKGLQ